MELGLELGWAPGLDRVKAPGRAQALPGRPGLQAQAQALSDRTHMRLGRYPHLRMRPGQKPLT